jgi:uncharacterized protein YlxW (UPF0749 family)
MEQISLFKLFIIQFKTFTSFLVFFAQLTTSTSSRPSISGLSTKRLTSTLNNINKKEKKLTETTNKSLDQYFFHERKDSKCKRQEKISKDKHFCK